MQSIIVVTPHPDDETLGAGGSLLRWHREGVAIDWLIITNMTSEAGWPADRIQARQAEIEKVRQEYGFRRVFDLGLAPASLDMIPGSRLVADIAQVFQEAQPHTVILPWRGDAHSDHAVVYHAALSCTKSFRYPSIKRVLAMEILSETNFGECEDLMPNYFCNISDYLDRKIEIMGMYESEMGTHPFPRSEESLRSLATLRGSQAGCRYAEAFRIVRWIERD